MTDWPTVVNTLVSLIAGGGIAIAGQSLADRRASRREHKARREDYRISSFNAQREALMKVQDIAASISRELSDENFRQEKTGEHFTPETPETINRQLSEIGALFHQLAPVAEQIGIAESKREEERPEGELERLEGEAEEITSKALATTMSLVGEVKEMERIVKKEVEFLQVKLNPLIRDLENNVIRAVSPPVAKAAREYLEAVREYNYGFGPDVARVEREHAARDWLQNSVGEALKAGPFTDQE
jgi:hypothetical protein